MKKKARADGDRDVVMKDDGVQSDTDDKLLGSQVAEDSEDVTEHTIRRG